MCRSLVAGMSRWTAVVVAAAAAASVAERGPGRVAVAVADRVCAGAPPPPPRRDVRIRRLLRVAHRGRWLALAARPRRHLSDAGLEPGLPVSRDDGNDK